MVAKKIKVDYGQDINPKTIEQFIQKNILGSRLAGQGRQQQARIRPKALKSPKRNKKTKKKKSPIRKKIPKS